MPRPNFFLAFPVDGAFVLTLPAPPTHFRLFAPEDVHCTLSFLGACGAPAAERALQAVEAAVRELRPNPIAATLGPVVPMGPKRNYSALSALLDQGREAASQLIGSLRDHASQAALGRNEKRPPKPHITVARPRRAATDAARAAGLAWAEQLQLGHVATEIDRIALYTWPEGPRLERLFRIVAELPLPAASPS